MALKQPESFTPTINPADDWNKWRKKFLIYFGASDHSQKSEDQQRDILLHIMGDAGLEIYENLAIDEPENGKVSAILEAISNHYKPYRNPTFRRYEFSTAVQQEHASIDQFVMELKQKAKDCDFGQLTDSLIRDRLICGLNDVTLKERLLREGDLPLNKAIDMCRSHEISKMQIKGMDSKGELVTHELKKGKDLHKKINKFGDKNQENKFDCERCLKTHLPRACPAYGKRCRKCSGQNHFAAACKSKNKIMPRRQVGAIANQEYEEEEEEFTIGTLNLAGGDKEWIEKIKINGDYCLFKLDTGSQVNIIPERIYLKLRNKPKIRKENIKIVSYSNHNLETMGVCEMQCTTSRGITRNLNFVLANTRFKAVLGLNACLEMKLLTRTNMVGTIETKNILDDYAEVFEGLGSLPDTYHIKVDDTVRPKICVPRRIPFALQSRVKRELENMEKNGIIEKVERPTDWVHPMVIAHKPKGKIRICIDSRSLNEAIKREHIQLPTQETLLAQLQGAKIFTVLDASKAFHQVKLDEESADLCTFATPQGRYRFVRMPFGIKSAPEVFQRAINKVFQDLEGVLCYYDDVLIYGRNEQEHNRRLVNVLNRAKTNNLKFDKGKVQLMENTVKYLGHRIGQEGVEVLPERARAIAVLKAPKDKTGLQKFLGMIGYLTRFIPNLATKTEYLRQLLKKNVKWHWDQEAKKDFKELKELVIEAPILGYYDPNKPVILNADASQYGMGAALIQNDHPIAFASATLTSTQRNYSQLEKELLAIIFAVEHFHYYVYGRECEVQSDHKPLVSIIKKSLEKLSPRVQKMIMRLQRYELNIKYVPGKLQYLSDTLSRDPREETLDTTDLEEGSEEIHMLVSVTSEKRRSIKENILEDTQLEKLVKLIQEGWPKRIQEVNENLRIFWPYRFELYMDQGLMFKGTSLVIPKKQRGNIIDRLHETHGGIIACKNRARGAVFWPGMTREIENKIKSCEICVKYSKRNRKEPLMPHEIPTGPWQKLGVDFMQLKGKNYVLVIDYFSKYIELGLMNTTNSEAVIKFLKNIFARHGIPYELMSDNGPPFDGAEFKKFVKEWDFKHTTSSPRFPKSNGMIERTVQTCKNRIEKSMQSGTDINIVLLNLRATPHDGLQAPSEILMGRRLRTLLPESEERLRPKFKIKDTERQLKENQQKQKKYADRGSRELKVLTPGQEVYYEHSEKDWRKGNIKELAKEPRSYQVEAESGKIYRRNRIDIKPVIEQEKTDDEREEPLRQEEAMEEKEMAGDDEQRKEMKTSRSGRTIRIPKRYQ